MKRLLIYTCVLVLVGVLASIDLAQGQESANASANAQTPEVNQPSPSSTPQPTAPPVDVQAPAAPPPTSPAQPGLFVFVPFPCPSLKYYQQAQAFVDRICAAAADSHLKVIIVRSCYNEGADGLKKNWWWDEISDLPNHYKKFIDDGTVKIVDQYPDLDLKATPCGFFYRDNKTIWTGILTQDDPATVLGTITQK